MRRGDGEVLRISPLLVGGKKRNMCMKKKLRDELNGWKLNFDEMLMLKFTETTCRTRSELGLEESKSMDT